MSQEDKNFYLPLDPRNGDHLNTKRAAALYLENIATGSGVALTSEQKAGISQFIDNTSRGFVGNMTMVCMGSNCPFLSACPLAKVKAKLPVGSSCPVEGSIVVLWVNKHLRALGIENPDDPAHSFDMDMLYELAGQELIRWRCSVHLSKIPNLVTTQQVSATMQGEPIFADVINPVLDVMERAGRTISKIREALVATRESQLKAGQISTDPTQRAAELREAAEKLAKARRLAQETVKDANFTIKDNK